MKAVHALVMEELVVKVILKTQFAVALFVVFAAMYVSAAETLVVVQAGKAGTVRCVMGDWKETSEGLQSPAGGRGLYAIRDLGPGDFRVFARLKLERMQATAASFMINDSHLIFDGRGGRLVIEGPLFADEKLSAEAGNVSIKPGQAFDLEIVREKGVARFAIDGREVVRMEKWDGPAQRIGFRPHRNQITLEKFEIQGNLVAAAQPFGTPVFISGKDGYFGYRIPALAVTTKGTVLAICEGRKNSFNDHGDIDLVLKRSTDNGKTWSAMQVIRDDGNNTAGNPAVLVDRDTGTIWLATCQNNKNVFMLHSDDDGVTWSAATDITADVKKPDWDWYATGPGSGIQIERGPHKGRLIIPCDHIEKESKRYCSHVIYSDDHGKTWKLGGTTPEDKVNECEVVELANGRLMLNMRNAGGGRKRQVAFSDDGGMNWKNQAFDEALIEPVCQGAIERYRWPGQDKPGVILFSNPASEHGRVNLTVRASFDDGKTWTASRVLNAGPSAYSDLAVLGDGQIGCLYEGGTDYDVQYMMFAAFGLDSLAGLAAQPSASAPLPPAPAPAKVGPPAGLRKLMDTPLRDPSVCRGPDGTYYLTGTSEPFWGFNNQNGIRIWKSPDLSKWEPLGTVWRYGDSPWHKPYLEARKPLWAPEIHYNKGTFWLTYSMPGWKAGNPKGMDPKNSGSGLLKSTTGKPEGPYVDVQPNERLGDEIDASLFEDDDGTMYFLWHSGKIAKMKPDMTGLAEPYHWLKTSTPDPDPKHHAGLCAGIFGKGSFDHVGYEGMFMFKRAGTYYLCCSDQIDRRYSCVVATAKSIYGPYSARYEAIPHGGHNTFFQDGQGQWWSTYFGPPWSERAAILPIDFGSDGRLILRQ